MFHEIVESGYKDRLSRSSGKQQGLPKEYLNIFLNSDASTFFYFSSVKAVVDAVSGKYLSEDTIPNPETAYGRSKLEAEKFILKKHNDWKSEKLECQSLTKQNKFSNKHETILRQAQNDIKKVYILRPCMIHGPENKGNLNLLFNRVKKGIPWPLGAYENKRSLTSIDNLVFIIP